MTPDLAALVERLNEAHETVLVGYPYYDVPAAILDAKAALESLAAENAKWHELHRVIAEELGSDKTSWPDHGNAPLAIAATFMLHKQAAERAERAEAANIVMADHLHKAEAERNALREFVARAINHDPIQTPELSVALSERLDRDQDRYERAEKMIEMERNTFQRQCAALQAERDALRLEIGSMRSSDWHKDAERYRWLRDGFIRYAENYLHTEKELLIIGGVLWRWRLKDNAPPTIDSAIDAAVTSQAAPPSP